MKIKPKLRKVRGFKGTGGGEDSSLLLRGASGEKVLGWKKENEMDSIGSISFA